ncbi:histone acetyltransferase 1 [Orbilia oligospora]|uniref:Histone acetyltransferase type B catalytic subunit n=1 Tax=Orbilia oligospora TaxID=2813651 RepID=A0A6G1LV17_ORBOL|nr:histone acetyltransferase 1 [Orbilia oligospora]KAF3204904.1 histone acetyltransferase 1 [Orbilia oligospora]KAF3211734.1 histone acetyltransferase 1 [Orbilia oligospora]KAF3225502.1 histone acetyltransferase 1 [Orbilia oligospora]KAF3234384.1 histone acetyltransferase 1 [Orbilia oligospora]
MADSDEWTIPNASGAITISLIPPSSFPASKSAESFHPTYTHQFFENEAIYGYKNLAVNLKFRQDDMSPSLKVTYDEKLSAPGGSTGGDEVTIDEVEDVFKEYLPEGTPESLAVAPSTFTPPGTIIHTYPSASTSSTFEIYHTNLSDPTTQAIIKNSQLLVPLFIEAGSAIDLSDPEEYLRDRWDVFFLYEHLPNDQFSFVGYCTVHKYWYFTLNHMDEKEFPHQYRARISQFLILAPYQGNQHGKTLYEIIVDEYLSSDRVKEIVVEDPSDRFEKLRDLCDYQRLKKQSLINDEAVETLLGRKKSREWIDTERAKAKMPMRQFQRIIELMLLEHILITKGPKYDEQLERYMTYVKDRLYRHNKDILMQLEREERSEKLHETYERVHSDYEAYLATLGSVAVQTRKASKGKRVIAGKRPAGFISTVEEDEEEEELLPPTKKTKVTK